VADAVILSRAVDGVLVVANAGKARRHHLAEALENLDRVGARTLGVVLNRVKRKGSAYGYAAQAAEASEPRAAQPAPERRDAPAVNPPATSGTSAVPVGVREGVEDGERR
jgi:Mrp family chromosome partitioning ATPase